MVLDHSVKDRVPHSDEIAFLRQYLKLGSLRLEDGLDHSVDAERDLLEEVAPVASLLVQPFVENAIWHGLSTKQGEKRVSVRFSERDGKVICQVEDNGVGRSAAPKRSQGGHCYRQDRNGRAAPVETPVAHRYQCQRTGIRRPPTHRQRTGTRLLLRQTLPQTSA